MNYIKHLAGFFERVATDERLNPTHISMYVSLFQFWNASRFQNPISISRNELMKVSKISAKATYHKCIKQLNDFGYLKYKPSYNPYKGSLIYLYDFQAGLPAGQAGIEQAIIQNHTKSETGVEQVVVPYINNTNIKNKTLKNLYTQAQKNDVQKLNGSLTPLSGRRGVGGEAGEGARRSDEAKEKSCGQKERKEFLIPVFMEVYNYFIEQGYPEKEAKKFFNYFQSNGWLVGGKAKMQDWRAASDNWMLNAGKYSNLHFHQEKVRVRYPNAKQLHISTSKNYNEPL